MPMRKVDCIQVRQCRAIRGSENPVAGEVTLKSSGEATSSSQVMSRRPIHVCASNWAGFLAGAIACRLPVARTESPRPGAGARETTRISAGADSVTPSKSSVCNASANRMRDAPKGAGSSETTPVAVASTRLSPRRSASACAGESRVSQTCAVAKAAATDSRSHAVRRLSAQSASAPAAAVRKTVAVRSGRMAAAVIPAIAALSKPANGRRCCKSDARFVTAGRRILGGTTYRYIN